MDPASIIGLVDASLNLAIKCASTLKRLNTIASQYKNARLTILSMVQNLDSLQLAWNRISVWSKSYVPDQDAAENGLIERLERFLETGALVMEALDEDLSTYDPDNLSLTDRSRLIWNGQGLQDHQNRLRDQATSMTLLLQAIQLPTIRETNEMLRITRKQFQKSDESAYSIVPSCMSSRLSISTTHSLSSDNYLSYHRLSFEDDLFTAKVYKRSYRTPLIKRLFRRKVELESETATITGPEGAFRSRFPDTEEHSIHGNDTDRHIISPRSDRGHIPSYYFLNDESVVNYQGVEGFPSLQPRPRFTLETSGDGCTVYWYTAGPLLVYHPDSVMVAIA
ncbi:hypothetical protein JMJ35_005062 [Cladonia borealis]|uniref:Fungal N-terminal domain-containing protein n=1 Tax=Cladonia borealis TaxID=184061 RepID=A0AA39V8L5_9LECA|nr:hypothetical protein JMJ35_005062 [Cladonia borealis]